MPGDGDVVRVVAHAAVARDDVASGSGGGGGSSGGGGRVRIELIEAIPCRRSGGGDEKKEAKKKKGGGHRPRKKSSSSTSESFLSSQWKPGPTRMTLVLSRSTSVADLLGQSKSKLRLRKKPVRAFVCVDGTPGGEVELGGDLWGLEDGTAIYVASFEATEMVTTGEESVGEGVGVNGEDPGNDDVTTTTPLVDPLDPVKRAYEERRRRKGAFPTTMTWSWQWGLPSDRAGAGWG